MTSTHRRIELRLPVPATDGTGTWELAATVHLPASLPDQPAVLVGLPGSGYGRHYFDIPEPGYSQAEHHTARGTVLIALDHLGVGESSIPPVAITDLETVATANDAAVRAALALLRDGSLAADLPAVQPSVVIGVGQSMGCFILVAMQAYHRTFDAVALLGGSMVCTTLPQPPDKPDVVIPEGTAADEAAMLVLSGTDWRYAFHFEDVPERLVQADLAGGLPLRETAPAWGSLTSPGLVNTLVLPGVVAKEAAAVDVPVLVALGERDVCRPMIEELAAFTSATDLAGFWLPRSAHMHNFAGTRQLLWERLDAFVSQLGGRSRST